MRKRGYPPAAIRAFCEQIGISRSDSIIDMSLLEACVRDELNRTANRALAVINPLKIVIENYPDNQEESLEVVWNQQAPESGRRIMPFTKEIYIEQTDFMENPVKGYFRLAPGAEVRLRHAYVIRCESAIYDEKGNIKELRCTYDPDTLGKNPEGRKVKGVIHWVSADKAHPISFYQYDRLFNVPNPGAAEDIHAVINHASLEVLQGFCEPALAEVASDAIFQFERLGYYAVNTQEGSQVKAFHRVVSLKDTWTASTV
jgi:glutaminyl-tRNA synthetase